MIAIPLHQSRVAPVLDWCSTILLIPKHAIESWCDGERLRVQMNVFDLLRLFHSRAVSAVICGAVSPNALRYGQHLGLEFIYGISGAVDEVIEAYRTGELDQARFRLPGCRCPGRPMPLADLSPDHHIPEQRGFHALKNRGKGGPMMHQWSQVRDRGCGGRKAGSAMVSVVCVCPKCGMEVPHRRRVPCAQDVCQACGTPLIRKPPAPEPYL